MVLKRFQYREYQDGGQVRGRRDGESQGHQESNVLLHGKNAKDDGDDAKHDHGDAGNADLLRFGGLAGRSTASYTSWAIDAEAVMARPATTASTVANATAEISAMKMSALFEK